MTKRIIGLLLVLVMCFSLCACGSKQAAPAPAAADNQAASTDAAAPADAGEKSKDFGRTDVNYGLSTDISSLDHIASTDQITNIIWRQLYDTLVEKDENGNWRGKLAESWEISDDGLTYTFHLRQDVICHDGLPMTAEDVAYSLNREINSAANGPLMVSMIDATVVDDYTVNLNMAAPYAGVLEVLLAWGRISSARTADYDAEPIGTGPYKFVSRSSGENIILEAWDQYYLGAPTIKTITFKVVADTTTQIAALQSGEIDFLTHAPLSAKMTVESDPNLVWQEAEHRGNVWVTMREDRAPFDNINARKAVQYCIDKEAMLLGGSEGMGNVLDTLWTSTVTASPEGTYKSKITYDPELAKEYLEKYKAETGASTVDVVILVPNQDLYKNPGMVLESMMNEVGFNATVNVIDRSIYWSTLTSGEYQLGVAGTSWPVEDADMNYMYLHSSTAGGQGYVPVIDDEVDRLLDAARTSADTEERRDLYCQLQERIDDQAYILTLFQQLNAVCFNKNLGGVSHNNLYQFYVYDWFWN